MGNKNKKSATRKQSEEAPNTRARVSQKAARSSTTITSSKIRSGGSTGIPRSFLIGAFVIVVVATFLVFPADVWSWNAGRGDSIPVRLEKFQTWFMEQDDTMMAPGIQLEPIPGFGYGLMFRGAPPPSSEAGATSESTTSSTTTIDLMTPILRIPSSVYFSAQKSQSKITAMHAEAASRISKGIHTVIKDKLLRQDVWIALELMIEDLKGPASRIFPYLQVLPQTTPPRLDTFSEDEWAELQDDDLVQHARNSKKQLQDLWEAHLSAPINERLLRSNTKEFPTPRIHLVFDDFHRWVVIVCSHAMILPKGGSSGEQVKYLVPMADMINHEPRPVETHDVPSSSYFHHFHRLEQKDNGFTIEVMADRTIAPNNQIFEEYGRLDNSLYLTAFGFVPEDNPHHCAMVFLPEPPQIWSQLREKHLPSICIHTDLQPLEGDLGWAYLTLLSEAMTASHEEHPTLSPDIWELYDCLFSSAGSRDCSTRRPTTTFLQGSGAILLLRQSANAQLRRSKTSLARDVELWNNEAHKWSLRKRLAVQFRMEEKKILNHIAQRF